MDVGELGLELLMQFKLELGIWIISGLAVSYLVGYMSVGYLPRWYISSGKC